MATSLLSLYQSILIPTLSNWIGTIDLCFLDTAVCNTKQRPGILNLLMKCRSDSTIVEENERNERLDWMQKRGVILERLVVKKDSKYSFQTLRQLLLKSNRLDYLECVGYTHLPALLSKIELDVDRLVIKEANSVFITNVLNQCHSVRCVDLSCCEGVRAKLIRNILKWFPSVQNISCPYYTVSRQWNSQASKFRDGGFNTFKIDSASLAQNERAYMACESYLERVHTLIMKDCAYWRGFSEKCVNLVVFEVNNIYNVQHYVEVLLENTKHLRRISITNCKNLKRIVLEMIVSWCSQLEYLKLLNCSKQQYDNDLNLLEQLPNLTYLETDDYFEQFTFERMIRGMEKLRIDLGCDSSKDEQHILKYQHIRGKCIDARTYQSFAYNGFEQLFRNNPILRSIKLENLGQLTDYDIGMLVELCPVLQHVSLCYNTLLTSACLDKIEELPDLVSLKLGRLKDISDSRLIQLVENRPRFNKLCFLPQCSGFGGAILTALTTHCPLMREFMITHNDLVTDDQVIELLKRCSFLRLVDFSFCPNVSCVILPVLVNRDWHSVNIEGTAISEDEAIVFMKECDFRCEVFKY